jgi:hypothetical protein
MKIAPLRLLAIVGLSPSVLVSWPASPFDATWRGTYHSQPTELRTDGTYPEKVNEFELQLREHSGALIDEIDLRRNAGAKPITNGKLFGSRACFDIVTENDDMRWCVEEFQCGEVLYGGPGNYAPYSPFPFVQGGYNSNSFAFTLLDDVGLAGFYPSGVPYSWFGTPSLTPGWRRLVPGL